MAFLTQRTQSVQVDRLHSSKVYVEAGVLQGAVLGPLMFLLYINDLPASVSSHVHLFADNLKRCPMELRELAYWALVWFKLNYAYFV